MVIALTAAEEDMLDGSHDISQRNYTFGTITCIMKNGNSDEYYGLASGHVLLGEAASDYAWPEISCNKAIISDCKSPDNPTKWMYPKLAATFHAGMEYTNWENAKTFVDVGIFQIRHALFEGKLLKLDMGSNNKGPPVMYEGDIRDLIGKEVVKVGRETGVTTGKVTAVNRTVIVKLPNGKELMLTGIIIVSPLDCDEFGRSGDSGSPIFLSCSAKNTMIAFICAGRYKEIPQADGTVVKKFKEIYCIRMDTTLDYIQKKANLDLVFPQEEVIFENKNHEHFKIF